MHVYGTPEINAFDIVSFSSLDLGGDFTPSQSIRVFVQQICVFGHEAGNPIGDGVAIFCECKMAGIKNVKIDIF